MLWFAILLVLTGGAAMALLLPFSRPTVSMKYKALLGSLLHLWRNEPRLRRAALVKGLLFAIFSAFWTVLALHLEQPPFFLGADAEGLFGITEVVGVLAAPVSGRLADKKGPDQIVSTGALSL